MSFEKYVGWTENPFERFNGMAISLKYPIIVAWGKSDMKENFEPKPIWCGEREGIWKIRDEYLCEWEKYRSLPVTEEMREHEDICEDYYLFIELYEDANASSSSICSPCSRGAKL